MKNWEYKIIVQSPVTEKKVYFEMPTKFNWEPEVDLNAMGDDGWELVSVTSIDHWVEGRTSQLNYYFKRERQT